MSDVTPTREFVELQARLAGRYSLERELGRGGMGIVFLARDVALERQVAIKLLPPLLAELPQFRERFLREARTAAQLSHPNIVAVYAVEDQGEIVFFVMAYVEGETLGQRLLRTGRLPPSQATRLIQEVAWALAYAHSRDVVHRDVKPDNILIDRGSGRAMVTDFGIARAAEARAGISAGEILGTAAYMSPEQAAGEQVDGRSDLYSLGVTSFVSLTGRLPFEAPTPLATLGMHLRDPAPLVRTVQPSVPLTLARTVDRCLAKDPVTRFQTGEELAEALAAAGTAIKDVPPEVRHYLRTVERAFVTSGIIFTGVLIFGQFVEFQPIQGPVQYVMVAMGLFTIVIAPWAYAFYAARRVRKAGMSFREVAAALASDARAREEEMEAPLREGSGGLAGELRMIRSIQLRFAGWFFRLVSLGHQVPEVSTSARDSHTEALLAKASAALFNALPLEQRRHFPEAPGVIERLEAIAEQLRGRRDEVAEMVSGFGLQPLTLSKREQDALRELKQSGDLAEARLASVLAALENVRLDLLRLKAGLGSQGELTLALDAAREVSAKIGIQIAAAEEAAASVSPNVWKDGITR